MEKELWQELLASALSKEECLISFPNLKQTDIVKIVESEAYQILKTIRDILRHPSWSDEVCYAKIDELITLFFDHGIITGDRHD